MDKIFNILIIHGPNLNLLGEREPDVYGRLTLTQINDELAALAGELSVSLEFFQSNHEGAIIDFLHDKKNSAHGAVINPGAYTHYSYAIRDAIAAVSYPVIEVHISDISKREPFRRVSVIKEVCIGQISGRGLHSYLDGLRPLVSYLQSGPSHGA